MAFNYQIINRLQNSSLFVVENHYYFFKKGAVRSLNNLINWSCIKTL